MRWSRSKVRSVVTVFVTTMFVMSLNYLRQVPSVDEKYKIGRDLLWLDGENCTEPAILDFPSLHIPGGTIASLVLPLLIVAYTCIFLARICEEYFVPAIKVICYKLGLSSDVAGATLMAAGVSSPDLFINLVGTFLTEGDIGVGTVVGCGVVNMLAVPSFCLLLSPAKEIKLDWWPINRDSLAYFLTVSVLVFSLQDSRIDWYEALVMFFLYVVYIEIMSYNTEIRQSIYRLWRKIRRKRRLHEKSQLLAKPSVLSLSYGFEEEFILLDELKDAGRVSLRSPPINSSWAQKLWWLLTWPIEAVLALTLPHHLSFPNLYIVTFFGCVIWVALASYLIAWMITVAGYAVKIPDSLMGLTFLGIGMSIPEAASSIIVARQGHGSMAVSNSLGSNIFDVLICLGLPWLIKSTYFPTTPGDHFIDINSHGFAISSIVLLSTLLVLYISLAVNKFTLKRSVAVLCLLMYIVFIVISILMELDIFFVSNLPMCPA